MSGTEAKTCRTCGEAKPLSEFYRDKGRPKNACKQCDRAQVKAWQEAERERMGEDAWRAYLAENTRRHRRRNPESVERGRLQRRAYDTAMRQLRIAHQDEFAALYAAELTKRGVAPR